MGEVKQDGALQQGADREREDRRRILHCPCFSLIQITFHKDPHDCLITRGTQGVMRARDETEAEEDMVKLINSRSAARRLLSFLFFSSFFLLSSMGLIEIASL